MGNIIKAYIKRPDEEVGHTAFISCALKNLQRIVEGYIETVTYSKDLVVICNEEGYIMGLPHNCKIYGCSLYGTIIAVGVGGEDFCDVGISWEEWKRLVQ